MTPLPWRKVYLDEFCAETKFLRVADMTGALPGTVQGTFLALMRQAARNPEGSLVELDVEDLAWYQRIPVELVRAIVDAFRRVKIILGDCLAHWRDRQGLDPVVENSREPVAQSQGVLATSTERVRRHRERKRADRDQLSLLLPIETPDETPTTVSPPVSPRPKPAETLDVSSALEREEERESQLRS